MFPVRRCRYSGAEVLSLLFLRHPSLVRRSAVLEVGAGIGLAAIAAATAMRGEEETQEREETAASRGLLCVTDGEEDAVQLSRVNLHLHCRRLLGGTDQGEGGEGTGEDEDGLLTQRAPLPLSSSAVATSVRVFPFDESSRPLLPPLSRRRSPLCPSSSPCGCSGVRRGAGCCRLSCPPCPPLCAAPSLWSTAPTCCTRGRRPRRCCRSPSPSWPRVATSSSPTLPAWPASARSSGGAASSGICAWPTSLSPPSSALRRCGGRGWTEVDVAVVARAAEWTAVDAAYGSRGLTLEQRSEGERRADEADAEDETTALRGLRTHEEEEEEEDDDG